MRAVSSLRFRWAKGFSLGFLNRLSVKVAAGLLVFLLLLAAATALLMSDGFRQAQDNATERSMAGLEEQGRAALLQLVLREARISDESLAQAESLATTAAEYMTLMIEQGGSVPWDSSVLVEASDGQLHDPSPRRVTDVWIGNTMSFDEQTDRDLSDSAVLDTLFPTLMDHHPDIVAIYYMNPQGVGRYYPAISIVNRLPPDFQTTEQPFFKLATPQNNPDHTAVWVPPYLDFVTSEPIATVSAPVYQGDVFRGVISVDLSLRRLIELSNSVRPASGGYAFLVDEHGHLVAAPPDAVNDFFGPVSRDFSIGETLGLPLASASNTELRRVLAAMQAGESGLVSFNLDGRPVLLAYAPLPSAGWSLATVAPLAEITQQAETVSAGIEQDARRTLLRTLATVGAGFILVLSGSMLLNRRLLTRPLQELTDGTRAIASGKLDHRIHLSTRDELGTLAASFNEMAAELADQRRHLEQRVADRTRELEALFEVTAVASASLDQEEVLRRSLARVVDVMNVHSGSIHLLDDDEQTLHLAAKENVQSRTIRNAPLLRRESMVARVMDKRGPIHVSYVEGDSPTTGQPLPDSSFLGVPLKVKGKVVGVLSVFGEAHRSFSTEEVTLLTSIADQVGVAVENARLYQQAEDLAVMQERQRLARELHDAVTQSLYSLTLLAETGRRAAHQGQAQQAEEYLARLKDVGRQALKEMRLLVYELRPLALAQEGLLGALQHRLDAVEKRAGIEARLQIEGHPDIDPDIEGPLYRIVQEALNNSLKHAGASRIDVLVRQQPEQLTLVIRDDGSGFDPAEDIDDGGMGLANLRSRSGQIGAELTVSSAPGTGTEIKITLATNQ